MVDYQIAIQISASTLNSSVSVELERRTEKTGSITFEGVLREVEIPPFSECGGIKLKFRNVSHLVGSPEDQPRRMSNWLHPPERLPKPAQSRLICIPRWDLRLKKASDLWGISDGVMSPMIEK